MHAVFLLTEPVPTLDSNAIVEWGVQNLIPIILGFIGLGIIASAKKGRISENAGTLTNVILGLGIIAGAALLYGFAGGLTSMIFGGS